ncbi:MAG: universal stress protein [Dehalococcoidia bacterium]
MKILATVDGSELSESILGPLQKLAASCGMATIRLISVLDPADIPSLATAPMVGGGASPRGEKVADTERRLLGEIGARLQELAETLRAEKLEVETAVLTGKPFEAIEAEARSFAPDLIAMATHGRSGIAEQIMGSVTTRVLKAGLAPLFIVSPHQ